MEVQHPALRYKSEREADDKSAVYHNTQRHGTLCRSTFGLGNAGGHEQFEGGGRAERDVSHSEIPRATTAARGRTMAGNGGQQLSASSLPYARGGGESLLRGPRRRAGATPLLR